MSLLLLAAACLVTGAASVACSDDDGNNENKYLIDVAPRDAIHFEAEGPFESVTLGVSSTWPGGYEVEVTREDWLNIKIGENTIEIVPAGNNESKEDIKGTVKLYVPDGPFVEIEVTQDRYIEYSYSWNMVWSEEFDGDQLDLNTWNIETGGGGWGNNEQQYYTDRSDNLRVEDGNLLIELKKETYQNRGYTSARINTLGKKEFAYGRIEASISFPSGGGTWPAFWMMGGTYRSEGWPLCGEIDIVEHVGNKPRQVINAIHTSQGNGNNGGHYSSYTDFDDVENHYHTYAIEWLKDERNGNDVIDFYFDETRTGRRWQQMEGDYYWPFNKPNFIILNMAIGGNLGGSIDDSIFQNDIIMKVDYIRAYERVATEIN